MVYLIWPMRFLRRSRSQGYKKKMKIRPDMFFEIQAQSDFLYGKNERK